MGQQAIHDIKPKIRSYWNPITWVGGKFDPQPNKLFLSENKKMMSLIKIIFEGLDPNDVVDMHCHILCDKKVNNEQGFITNKFKSIWYPYYYIKSKIFQSGAGVTIGNVNQPYVDRLKKLLFNFTNGFGLASQKIEQKQLLSLQQQQGHAKCMLLAFDQIYDIDGEMRSDLTTFYTPNEYVWEVVNSNPDYFLMAMSVHPYRNDAVQELEKWAARGVRIVKLLPNSMNINMSLLENHQLHPKLKAYFERAKELGLILLVHVGDEHSVDGHFLDNKLGNPLLLLEALNIGVKIIAAHVASEGTNEDIQNNNRVVPSIDLLIRLMRSPAFANILFADISAITMFKRLNTFEKIIKATDIHSRLFYGSDYPLPGINVLIHIRPLKQYLRNIIIGDIDLSVADQSDLLSDIYAFNPLLFDFAVKRLIKLEDSNGETLQFPSSCFQRSQFEKINNIQVWGCQQYQSDQKMQRNQFQFQVKK